MRWEKYKVPLLKLGLIVTSAVAVVSLASVFILNARLKTQNAQQTSVRETSQAEERQELEQQLMVYGCADAKALVVRDSLTLPSCVGDEMVMNGEEGVFAANDADGSYYVYRLSDGELIASYTNASYDRALFIGQNRILLEDSGHFYCFDYTSGMQLWKWQFPYEDCLWQYDEGSEVIYLMKAAPDRGAEDAMTGGSEDDRYGEVTLSHDIYVLSVNELTVNYIRPTDLMEEESRYASSVITDISLSGDRTMLLINGSLTNEEEHADSYFSRIYQLDAVSFEDASLSGSETDEENVTQPTLLQTSGLVCEVTAGYHESENYGRRMLTRWIDNESVLEYSEESDTSDDYGEDEEDSEDSSGTSGAEEIDELDREPESVQWTVRKRTLPYASTEWRVNGSGVPTEDPRLLHYEDDDTSDLILVLSRFVLTLDTADGREVSRLIDTDEFIYVEPKSERPAMYITASGSVIQGRRNYSLGISDIAAVEKLGNTYYVSAGSSVYMYTIAANAADSGTVLKDSDEILWNRALISGDGRYAAVSGQRYLRLYSTKDGSRLYQNIGTQSAGADVVFAGDRFCHLDATGQNFMIYDPDTGITAQAALPGAVSTQSSEIRSHGSRYVLAAREDGQTVWIIDTEAGEVCRTFTAKDLCEAAELPPEGSTLEYCSMSPDMHFLVFSVKVSDGAGAITLKACILDLSTSGAVLSDDLADCLNASPDDLPQPGSDAGAYSEDGQYAVFVSSGSAVSVFDLAKGTCIFRRNCGELAAQPAFAPDNHIVCETKAGDICVLDPKDGRFVTVSGDGSAVLSDELFSMDRPGAQVTLSFDRNESRMYASGVRNGKKFIRVYTISDEGVLTPETEIPQAAACGASLVLMRYGDAAAELFPYLSMDELRARAAASAEQPPAF